MQDDFLKSICGLIPQVMTLPSHAVKSVKHVIIATWFLVIAHFVIKLSTIYTFSRMGIYDLQVDPVRFISHLVLLLNTGQIL